MPRSIIDTESSRPAYVRRQILTAVFAVLVLAAVLVFGYAAWQSKHAAPGPITPAAPAGAPAHPASYPGN